MHCYSMPEEVSADAVDNATPADTADDATPEKSKETPKV